MCVYEFFFATGVLQVGIFECECQCECSVIFILFVSGSVFVLNFSCSCVFFPSLLLLFLSQTIAFKTVISCSEYKLALFPFLVSHLPTSTDVVQSF